MKFRCIFILILVVSLTKVSAQETHHSFQGLELEVSGGQSENFDLFQQSGKKFLTEKSLQTRGLSLSYLFPVWEKWSLKAGLKGAMFYYPIRSENIEPPYLDTPYAFKSNIFQENSYSLGANAHIMCFFPLTSSLNLTAEFGAGLDFFLSKSNGTSKMGKLSDDDDEYILHTNVIDDSDNGPVANISLGFAFNKIFYRKHMIGLNFYYQYAFADVKDIDYEFQLNDPYVSEGSIQFSPSVYGISLGYTFLFKR